jgi:hypothetical protein
MLNLTVFLETKIKISNQIISYSWICKKIKSTNSSLMAKKTIQKDVRRKKGDKRKNVAKKKELAV